MELMSRVLCEDWWSDQETNEGAELQEKRAVLQYETLDVLAVFAPYHTNVFKK